MARTILIVDDEPHIVELIQHHVASAGFDTMTASNGREALELARTANPDLLILDVMLPEMDGLEVCRRLRESSDVPILMLTARREEIDRVLGLELGADDYLTKPFSPREMMARVKAILRRSEGRSESPKEQLEIGVLRIDLIGHQAYLDDEPLSLTRTEFALLQVLAEDPGRAFTRNDLLDRVWGEEYVGDARIVDVYIRYLREKLGDESSLIETVRGVGYRLRREPHA